MLHDVGICCVQFETSQTFCPAYANISIVLVTDEPGGCIPASAGWKGVRIHAKDHVNMGSTNPGQF